MTTDREGSKRRHAGRLRSLHSGQGRYSCTTETTSTNPGVSNAATAPAGPRGWWLGGALLVAWLVLWNRLRIDWSVNDQYAYGWFVPPLALALLWLRWRDRPVTVWPGRSLIVFATVAAAVCLALLLPVRLIEEPNGDWRLLSWVHAGLLATLSLLAAAWCGGKPWMRHFAFPVGFLLLALPWPSGPEQALVQGLQRGVAGLAAEGMNLLGIPAEQQGNLIRVRDQMVGVNEACSGIRSLQTVLMAALFLGELSRLSLARRAILLMGGVAVAMVANVFRSSLLVWIAAQHGTAALQKSHDAAGVSVLVIVFLGLLCLNGWLERKPGALTGAIEASGSTPVPVGRWVPVGAVWAILAWLAAVEIGTESWYRLHERGRTPRPSWTVAFPPDAPGFEKLTVDDVSRSLLRYDEGREARWHLADTPAGNCTAFFFRWEPGRTSTTLAVMHQPTTCLPSGGLRQVADAGIEPVPAPGGFTLPIHGYEFDLRGQLLYVYYVVWQDRTGYELPAPASARSTDRFAAVRLGERNLGQQSLELVVTGATDFQAANVLCRKIIRRIVRPKE